MKGIEQLDTVLKYLNHEEPQKELKVQIRERLPIKVSEKTLLQILDKLCKDGYVDFTHLEVRHIETGNVTKGRKIYYITFDGVIFQESGGYMQEKITLSFESKRVERVERNTLAMLIVASFSTGLLVIIEMYKIWHHLTYE